MKAKLKNSKKIWMIAGTVLILFAVLGALASYAAVGEMELLHSSMASTMSTFVNKYERAKGIEKISADLDEELISTLKFLVDNTFRETEDTQAALDVLQRDGFDYYLIDASGKMYRAKGSGDLELDQEQIRQLISEGKLTVGSDGKEIYYGSMEVPQGTLIACYKRPMVLGSNSALTGISDRFNYFVAPVQGGVIEESSDANLLGSNVPENLESGAFGADKNLKSKSDAYHYGFAELAIGKAYCLTYEADGYLFGLYYNYSDIVHDIFGSMLTPTVVTVGSFGVILAFFFVLWGKGWNEEKKKWVRLFKSKLCFEKSQVRHISCFALITLIISALFISLFLELSAYSMQNVLSNQNLNMLSENIEACEKDKKIVEGLVKDNLHGIAEQLSDLFVLNREICTHDRLKEFAENCYVSEITVYNASGISEVSSGSYVGYELTKNESNPMYAVRRIFTDDPKYVFVNYGNESGKYVLAQRRKDSPGIICVEYKNSNLSKLLSYYSKDDAIRNTDFGNATTFFVKLDEEGKTYMVKPYSTQISASNVPMTETMEQDNYSGIAKINQSDLFVNTKRSGNVAVASAVECSEMNATILTVVSLLVSAYVLFMVLLFCGCICRVEWSETEEEQSETEKASFFNDRSRKSLFADNCFRKMIKYEVFVLIIGFCLMLFKETAGGQNLLQFLLNGKWDKGVNLFSAISSIIVAVGVLILLFLLKRLILFLGKSTGAKGLTVSSIASSVLQFIGLFFIVLYTLYQFGVNTTALLASAGIAGLVIGIAAKDIFGDLIAGLFLIFEGNIRVGDFIRIKDFRGEVSEIGARVTTIKRFNSKMIVNNSDFKQYYRLSDEPSGAYLEIKVAPEEDLNKLQKLIEDSAKWYQSRIPELTDGPWFLNVSHVDSGGITICICGECTEERTEATKRKLLLNTIELFRENGITMK